MKSKKSKLHDDKKPGSTRATPRQTKVSKSRTQSAPIVTLHGTVGNQAIQRIYKSRNSKSDFSVSQSKDGIEREASRVADEVLSMSRIETPGTVGTNIQRTTDKNEGKPEKATEYRPRSVQRGAKPLPESVRAFFEPRFGQDFSEVRIHTGREAHEASRQINAKAFTTGNDIFFANRNYRPNSRDGKRLLAHELTHVIQHRLSGNDILMRQEGNDRHQEEFPFREQISDLYRAREIVGETLRKGNVTKVEMNSLEGAVNVLFGPGSITKSTLSGIEASGEAIKQGGWEAAGGWTALIASPLWVFAGITLGRAIDPYVGILQNTYHFFNEVGDEYVFSEQEIQALRELDQKLEKQIRRLIVKQNKMIDKPTRKSSGAIR